VTTHRLRHGPKKRQGERKRKKEDSAIEVSRCRYKCRGVGGRAVAAAIKVSWM